MKSTTQRLIQDCAKRGVTLEPHGNMLLVTPEESVTPELVEQLRQHKSEILTILESKRRMAAQNLVKQILCGEWTGCNEQMGNRLSSQLLKLKKTATRDRALVKLAQEVTK